MKMIEILALKVYLLIVNKKLIHEQVSVYLLRLENLYCFCKHCLCSERETVRE